MSCDDGSRVAELSSEEVWLNSSDSIEGMVVGAEWSGVALGRVKGEGRGQLKREGREGIEGETSEGEKR